MSVSDSHLATDYFGTQLTKQIHPSAESFLDIVKNDRQSHSPETVPNLYPIYKFIQSDFLTPHLAYIKLTNSSETPSPSFLLESAKNGDTVDRYTFMGHSPRKIIKTGPLEGAEVDPLVLLEKELKGTRQAQLPGIPRLSGGAIGYISYDCIKYFEPKTERKLKDVLQLPEAALMLFDTIVAFDNVYQRFQVIGNVSLSVDDSDEAILEKYYKTREEVEKISKVVFDNKTVPYYEQKDIIQGQTFTSNIGQEGYENHVRKLKEHILKGDIFQAVPSQRVARPTSLHPFNIYRHLRTVNPSPYMFYIDYLDFQVVGASPELLVKSDNNNKIITHPIAGTLPRGKTIEEDDNYAKQLKSSLKDRAEHVMLVDLARNDINRVCEPTSTTVDRLLTVERFSHVMHLVSEVSGTLRPNKTRFDAFRSIFPAGTVSGAPKVRAMQLIGELEGEKRGVYAGAVGHWSYDGKSMDTCIALRTMVVKDGVAYLQAGGGIVYDSDPYDEYIETMNKMRSNNNTILEAEKIWTDRLARDENQSESEENDQ
ncbi:Anthranilate synthase component 1 [Komagataella phaffii]|uniref:anthranilate synthase n=1 Tax=Komagataella phaffii (strain GS115 / ATCC 20864) TaxID=644223 RepID=C4QZU0_KOMPG|nr:Anthranilate synthase, catalyzes the initial step of tryptophan biosynthesis, forms multifunctional [Komagataella phaffii GS115]AOA68195.1 GQ68_01205T0 [Komagataella phaffii GS115]CAH2448738.1 Protein with low similarity to DnaJ domain containing proteins [Komagataella phaffii CBS 7435]CAY68764.1 Anthranilate synthase, catalyzes the initial step of tryptophan biosynthesis, forms multifunctional [Komagataella phaffii GS115]